MANLPVSGSPHTFSISLISKTDGSILQNPTLAAGDVQVSTDGGALAPITSLPVVSPASSGIVQVTLTSSEVGNDRFSVIFADAAGDEWKDIYYHEILSAPQSGGSGGTGTSFVDGPIEMVIDEDSIIEIEVSND